MSIKKEFENGRVVTFDFVPIFRRDRMKVLKVFLWSRLLPILRMKSKFYNHQIITERIGFCVLKISSLEDFKF